MVGTASAVKPTAVFQSRHVGELEIKAQAAQASGTVQLEDTVMGTVVGMVDSEGHVEGGNLVDNDTAKPDKEGKRKGNPFDNETLKEDPHGIVVELAERGIVPVMFKESLGDWQEIRESVEKFKVKSVTNKQSGQL